MRTRTKITVTVATAMMLLLMAVPAWAQSADLELVGEAAGLVLVPPDKKLLDLGNMNPGDTRQSTLKIRNDYSRWYDLWLRAEDPTAQKPSLLEQLELTVTLRGEKLYQGPVAGFAGDTISLGRFRPGESGELVATVHLPGPETGNEFQGKSASVKWVFTAQTSGGGGGGGGGGEGGGGGGKPRPPEEIEVPPEVPPTGIPKIPPEVPVEPPLLLEVPPEPVPTGIPLTMPKTGEDLPYLYYLLGGLALLAGSQLACTRKRR
ncbi:MAG: hypothetical protein GX489_10300 [Firmicutes bacterium]|nr:hypothetical protein [Bacillota bacterium]